MAIVTLTNEVRTEFPKGRPVDEPPPKVEDPVPVEEVKAEEEEKPKKKHTFDERLEKMASQKKEALAEAEVARRESADLKARLEALEKAGQPKDGKPKAEEFTDALKYAEALADWRFNEKLKEQSAKDAADKASAEAQRIASEWQKKVKKTAKEIEDYDEVTEAAKDMPISYALRDAIVDSDIGPRIHYFLAQNEELVEELNKMSVSRMNREIGKIEAKLEAELAKPRNEKGEFVKAEETPRRRIAEPPEPINPIKGIGSTTTGSVDSEGNVLNGKAFRDEMKKKLYR